jgi:hypothetical protein
VFYSFSKSYYSANGYYFISTLREAEHVEDWLFVLLAKEARMRPTFIIACAVTGVLGLVASSLLSEAGAAPRSKYKYSGRTAPICATRATRDLIATSR